jgi:hypothetical protein
MDLTVPAELSYTDIRKRPYVTKHAIEFNVYHQTAKTNLVYFGLPTKTKRAEA